MKNFGSIRVLCALALLAGGAALKAQTPNDPAITALSVMGVVSELKPDTRQVIVTTAAGNQVTVTLSDRTVYMRIPPGEKTKDKFIKIAPTDFAAGDSVFARGRMSDDRKSMPALEFYVMSKGDIAEKKERERSEWSKRGIAGTVSVTPGWTIHAPCCRTRANTCCACATSTHPCPALTIQIIPTALSDHLKYRRHLLLRVER